MPGSSAQVLELRGVSHHYDALASVSGIDFGIQPGEIACLVGPSGCGKTTLLRLISGLEAPSAGEIRMGGATVAGPRVFLPPEKRPVGMVFQDYALFPHLNVNQNIVFGLKKVEPTLRYRRAQEIMTQLGIADLWDRFPHTLSGGQQQRIALARALALEPKLMLMDEPFSGLDATLRHSVREETRQILRTRNTATVLVTHDGEEAMHLADRIILMRMGRVEQIGSPEEVFFQPASYFAAQFFGSANLLQGRVREGHLESGLGRWKAPPGCPADAGLRLVVRHQAFRFGDAVSDLPDPIAFPAQVIESKLIGGQRQSKLRATIPAPGFPASEFYAFHRATTSLVSGSVIQCLLDPRMLHAFPLKKG